MKRRDLLKAASVSAGALAISPFVGRVESVSCETPREVDVLVVGGGSAGSVAALQAGRAGAKTALLEMGSQLGGTTTTGGVSFPGLFHAWGKQVIAGIGWELVQKAVKLDGGSMPDFTKKPEHYSHHHVTINGQLYAALVEEECLKAGVSLAYYQFPLAAEKTADGWRVDVVGKGVRYQIACKQLIDCTGGADVVGLLGLGRLREDTTQPGTLIFKLGGYDPDKLDETEIQSRYLKALSDGELKKGDFCLVRALFKIFLFTGGLNGQHVFGADSSTAATKTGANIAGRRSVLRLLRFVRTLPGCENARLEMMMQETAVRETYRIVGEKMITYDDYMTGREYDDAVCYSFYKIDVHTHEGAIGERLSQGIVPTIPLGALVPKGSRNLLVAGRSVSSERLANGALRVQASCMAMGQAAGAASALAARKGTTPTSVALDDIRSLLGQHGAIVPA